MDTKGTTGEYGDIVICERNNNKTNKAKERVRDEKKEREKEKLKNGRSSGGLSTNAEAEGRRGW